MSSGRAISRSLLSGLAARFLPFLRESVISVRLRSVDPVARILRRLGALELAHVVVRGIVKRYPNYARAWDAHFMLGVRRKDWSGSVALWRTHGSGQGARLSPETTARLALAMRQTDLLAEAEAVLRPLVDSGSESSDVVEQYALIAREARHRDDFDLVAATGSRIARFTPGAARVAPLLREVDPSTNRATVETDEIADGLQHIFCRTHRFVGQTSNRGLVEKCILSDTPEPKVWQAFQHGILAPPPFGPDLAMPIAIEAGPVLTCIYFAAIDGSPLAQHAFQRDIIRYARSLGAFNARNVLSSSEWKETGLPVLVEPSISNLLANLERLLMRRSSLDGGAMLKQWSFLKESWKDIQQRRLVIPQCFLHNDFEPRHILEVGDREVLIDFGNAAIGRLGWDLRSVLAESGELQFDDQAVDRLIDGYLVGVREFLPEVRREDVVVELWWGYFIRIVWLARCTLRTMRSDYVPALRRAMRKAHQVAEMST